MRLGFIECSNSQIKILEQLSAILDSNFSDIQLVHLTCPQTSKIPVCSKRLLKEGADSVVAFVLASAEESNMLGIISEKIMDVEISEGKFVFLVVVYDDEARTEEQLATLGISRIEDSINSLLGLSKSSNTHKNEENSLPIDDTSLDMSAGTNLKDSSENLTGQSDPNVHSLF